MYVVLTEHETSRSTPCHTRPSVDISALRLSPLTEARFWQSLNTVPDLMSPPGRRPKVRHTVTHHIVTKGPPVTARPRRLAPAKLKQAKKEFDRLQKIGIIRPSSSPWASSLHMVPKKLGD